MQMSLRKLGIVMGRVGYKMSMKRVCGMTGETGGRMAGRMAVYDFINDFIQRFHSSVKVIKLIYSVRIKCLVYV